MSVFKSRRVLERDYTPPRLPHRDLELRELWGYFEPVLSEDVTARVHVHGPMGTGKTVLCRRFGRDFEEEASRRGVNLRYVHINLSYTPKLQYVLARLLDQVSFLTTPRSGLSPEEMFLDIVRTLSREDCGLVLALDEVDTYLREKGEPKIFYMLSRIHELYPDPVPRVSLIYVSRSLDWMEKLDRATLETLGRVSVVQMKEYGLPEIRDIVSYRAEEAFLSTAFSEEIIEFIADLALGNGGVRYALELLQEAGGLADRDYARSVRPEHVRRAHFNIPKGINGAYYPADLSLHKQLFLTAVIEALENTWDPYIDVDEIYERYQGVCKEHGREPVKTEAIQVYFRDLEVEGYILLKEKGALVGVEFPLERMKVSVEEALKHTLQLADDF